MPRIRQLPPSVVTKIAAGEVIERPASVIKELLENSIDAGSTRIDVEIEQGGVERIVVADDGCGIAPEDLELAFASHATSKLQDADDLFRIGTLGFRGEALASISGVAQVTLQSRPTGQECGAEVQCHGGAVAERKPWNGSPGTRIEVRHLFYNTPVRRKFLKTTSTELGHVCEAVTRLALAYPTLHLTLKHNGKRVYEVPATASLPERIGLFFGGDVRESLYEIEAARGPVRLYGYIANPAQDRGNARMQYLFLNGRWVRDRSLGHAVQEAYRGLLMVSRYAIAFLFLELPPDQVDVNVHPTKCEVRFRDSSALFHLVLTTIRSRLNAANLIPLLQPPEAAAPFPVTPQPIYSAPALPPSPPALGGRGQGEGGTGPVEDFVLPSAPVPVPSDTIAFGLPLNGAGNGKALQIHDAYLVLETPDGMLVIDQHALHERILFEQFQRRLRAGQLEKQRLLIPEPVDLTAEQAARTLEAQSELNELGLEVSDFGGGTVLLSSYPTLLGKLAPAAILREVVDFLVTQERAPTREILLNGLMSLMACKAAVKAGDRLSAEQIAALLDQRHLTVDGHHCPHGRPTQLLFSRYELDKQFGRI
ncbi:MAG: DNA mismatch repair endonuclease MutL [Gemmataceae bacterium]